MLAPSGPILANPPPSCFSGPTSTPPSDPPSLSFPPTSNNYAQPRSSTSCPIAVCRRPRQFPSRDPTSARSQPVCSRSPRLFDAVLSLHHPVAMDQWQPYSDSAAAAGGSRRYNNGASSQMTSRDYNNGTSPVQPPLGFKYDQYQGLAAQQQNSAVSPISTPQLRDGNGDVPMQDAESYAGVKYPMRPHHQQHLSGGRSMALHSPQEPSAAAQRYSPMEVISPTSPYAPKSAGGSQFSQPPAQRQSPSRSSDYPPHSPYYGSRQQVSQLSPINPHAPGQESYSPSSAAVTPMDSNFAMDPKSPRRLTQQAVPIMTRGPVPEARKIRGPADLRPKVNAQPPFRRANPEGGFISVCLLVLLSCYSCD